MDAEIDPRGLPELERNLKLSAQILRYLIVLSEK
jgi:ribosomal protein S6